MAKISVQDITSDLANNTGVLDELMFSLQEKLDTQYENGRIKGSDYSKVYLGSVEAVLQQSIIFLLGKQQADKQAELLSAQTEIALEEAKLIPKKGLQMDADIAKTNAEIALIQQNTLNAEKEGAILSRNLDKLSTEISLLNAEITNKSIEGNLLREQIDKTSAETNRIIAETSIIGKELEIKAQELIIRQNEAKIKLYELSTVLPTENRLKEAQINKLEKELLVLVNQSSKLNQETNNLKEEFKNISKQGEVLINQASKLEQEVDNLEEELKNITKQGNVIDNQADKIEEEAELLRHKQLIERAQIDDEITIGDNYILRGVPASGIAAGVIGKQKNLIQAQTDGFTDDALIKAAKIKADVLAAGASLGAFTSLRVQDYPIDYGSELSSMKAKSEG